MIVLIMHVYIYSLLSKIVYQNYYIHNGKDDSEIRGKFQREYSNY